MAVSTVATNGKFIGAVFSNGNLICLDMDGRQKWATNLGTPQSTYGYSNSLMVYDDILLVQYDSREKLSLMGYDFDSGKLIWETMRTGHPVWSSPVLAYFGGKPQVVINGNPNVSAYDPVTGAELWSVECLSGDVGPSLAVNSTMCYSVTDYQRLAAIKSGTGASILWEDNSYTPDVSSPVATDELLFLSTGNGDIACYDAQKGDTLWTRYIEETFYASPMIADENVYFLDRSGTMHIVKADGAFELISMSKLGERADCTPAFSDKNIYIRGRKNIYCISEN
jgi:outer membrane protein assembly factor BamB